MMRFGKKAAIVTAAAMLTATAVTGCGGTLDSDAVVATVGTEEISLGVANFYARLTQGQYETYYAGMMGTTPDQMWAQEYSEDQNFEQVTKESLLEGLEDLYIVAQHAGDYNVSLTDEEKTAIAAAAEQFDKDNTDSAKSAVTGYKKNIEKYLELITIQTKMEKAMKEGVDENVTDEEAAQKSMQYAYFAYSTTDDSGNTTALTDEEKATLKGIAEDFAAKVKDGGDFEALATTAGTEAKTATFDSETTTPSTELIAAADALEKEGDCTDIIETDTGIYVAKLTSLLDREATDSKKESIVEQRKQDQYNSLLEGWKKDTEINVNEKVWAKVDFSKKGITIITNKKEDSGDGAAE